MSMTVGQLRATLEGQPADRLVVMARPAEGNGNPPLAEVSEAMYLPDCAWSGYTYPTPEWLADEIATGSGSFSEEDGAPDDAVRVVLLGPVN